MSGISGHAPPSMGLNDSVGVGAGLTGEVGEAVDGTDSVPHPQLSLTKAGK